MDKQIIKILGKYLNSLKADQLEEFKKALCSMNPPQGTNKIQVNQLKNKSTKEIAELIVECYTIQKGPSHVIKVFKAINLNQKASDLQKELKQETTTKKTEETPSSAIPTKAGKKTATGKTTGATAVSQSKKKMKTPAKNGNAVCNPPKTKKAKTSTSTSDAIPGTSQNTEQTSTKKKAPKRKLDKSEPDQIDEKLKKPNKAKVVSPQLTLKEKLLKTLEELKQEQFENFKMRLKDEEFLSRNDYDSMRTSELENKNRMEVSELLIRRYTKERALPLTILVLEGIGEKQLAKNLRAYLDAKTLENIDANIP
ncbi:uncharacterized protein LOC143923525 [Lithobates pipiens]